MIPRLNTCQWCNTEGPEISPLQRDARELHRALHDLFCLAAEALRIDRLVGWLAKRLPA